MLKSFLRTITNKKQILFFMKRNKYLLLSNGTLSLNSYYIYKKICNFIFLFLFKDNLNNRIISLNNVLKQFRLHSFSGNLNFNKLASLENPYYNKYD
jgi:hypothetical protein